MKTLEQIIEQFIGKPVFTELAEVLHNNSEDFRNAEQDYFAAISYLRQALPDSDKPGLDDYLESWGSDIISDAVYAGYLGFRMNLENFRNPSGLPIRGLDFIDHQDGQLYGTFPVNRRNGAVQTAFFKRNHIEYDRYLEDILTFFIYLECAGTKLAHYAGYILANHLLPWMEADYQPDMQQTATYAEELKNYVGFLPFSLD